MVKKKKSPHDICKLVRFTEDEFAIIEHAAQHENLPIAVFVRQLAVEAATKIESAREEVAQAPRWTRYLKSKKLLTERASDEPMAI